MRQLSMCSLAVVVAGCGVGDLSTSESQSNSVGASLNISNALRSNALRSNALRSNALRSNALRSNGLSITGVVSGGTAVAGSGLDSWLRTDVYAPIALKYVVACALPTGQSASFYYTNTLGQVVFGSWSGTLGVAPAWASGPLDTAAQERLTACLMALTNSLETPIMVSMRGLSGYMSESSTELTGWRGREGAFWGNLFLGTLYACHYAPANIATHAEVDLPGRTCSYNPTKCGYTDMGDCATVCVAGTDASGSAIYTSCSGSLNVANTYLQTICGNGTCEVGESKAACPDDCGIGGIGTVAMCGKYAC